jgi:RNA polymerase sigma-70 factor (ECF subfamily)
MMALSAVHQQEERPPFPEIILQHQEAVYRYLLRFTRDVSDAQDLFQETFLRAHRAYAVLPAEANVRAWLMRIAINLTKNYVRDRQRRRRILVGPLTDESPQEEIAADSDTEGLMISQETAQTLLAAIDDLPFHQRAALIQRQFDGLDYAAIAVHLGCSQESARAHVYQALRKLRATLAHSPSVSLGGQKG